VVRLNENNREVLQRQLQAARDRFEVGEITRTDVSQARARVAGAKAETIQARGDLQASRAAYEKVIGHPPEAVSTPDMPDGLPESKDALVAKAIEDNPRVDAAQEAARAARHNARAVKGELLPSLALQAQASRSWEQQEPRDRYTTYSATASLSIPLYQSGAVYSRLREARQTVGQRRMEGARARRAAAEQGASAWENLQAARASLESIKAQIEAADLALEGVKREAQVGARTTLDVLDAEQELLNAKVDRVKARRNALVAAYRVLAAKGALTAEALGLSVTPYQPATHYKAVEDKWFGGSVDETRE